MHSLTLKFKSVLNLFLKSGCVCCQRPTTTEFCQNCTKQLQSCQLSDRSDQWRGKLPVFAWGTYGGALKRAIACLKYDNQPQIARPLGYWLAQAWLSSLITNKALIVVPIPLHADKQKQRGYNQAALLAQSFCQVTGLKLQLQGLERQRSTQAQFGLSASEREQNLVKAFQLGSGFSRRPTQPVLLLDDIYTTGATVRSAAQVLQKAGIPVFGTVAVAIAQKPKLVAGESSKENVE